DAFSARVSAVRLFMAAQRAADRRRAQAAVAVDGRHRRLRAPALASPRGLLHVNGAGNRSTRRHADAPSRRLSDRGRETDEGSLMEDTHVHALDYVSALRRRKWWLIAPIAASVVIGLALVKFLPKEYTSTATLGVMAPIVSPNLVNQSTA